MPDLSSYNGCPADGNVQRCPRGLPEASIALRMFFPHALEQRDSELRPMTVMHSASCCGLPHHVNLSASKQWCARGGFLQSLVRSNPWQNLHIESFAKHSVQMVERGGRSLGEEIIPTARRGQPTRATVESQRDDGLLQKPTAAFHEANDMTSFEHFIGRVDWLTSSLA